MEMAGGARTVGRAARGLALALALGALAAPIAAAQEPPAPLDLDAPAVELAEAQEALSPQPGAGPVDAGRGATAELRDLALVLPQLEGRRRQAARALLARPPANDGGTEPFPAAEWSGSAVEAAPVDTAHFRVHYVTNTEDAPDLTDVLPANGIPDYVELVALRAEDSYDIENGLLGWPGAKPDGNRGGDSKVDIYLADICAPGFCLFGYANPDDTGADCTNPPFRCFAYLVLDDDYAKAEFGYPDPDVPLSVTIAHEYNHILQFAIDAALDTWMFESTATWAEEQVFPDADDWVASFMKPWAHDPEQPITNPGATGGLRIYGSAVWNHWLAQGDSGFGAGVVLDSWQRGHKTKPRDFAIDAYHRGIHHNGGAGFGREFAQFTAATSEWRTGDGGFPDAADLTDVHRQGRLLALGRGGRPVVLDHAAYRLLRVDAGNAASIRLRVRAPRRTRTGIALVGRDGGPTGGTVTRRVRYMANGGKGTVRLGDAQSFERITAVIANADGRVNANYTYLRDDRTFRARIAHG